MVCHLANSQHPDPISFRTRAEDGEMNKMVAVVVKQKKTVYGILVAMDKGSGKELSGETFHSNSFGTPR